MGSPQSGTEKRLTPTITTKTRLNTIMKPAAKFLKDAKALVKEGKFSKAHDVLTDAMQIYPNNKAINKYAEYVGDILANDYA